MGLYYLNDPETGRFINADVNLEGGLNLFAYCYNNPVNFADYDGEFAVIATLGALTAADLIIGGGILASGAAAIWSASPAGKKTINKLAQATDKAVRSAVQTVKTALTPAAPGKPDNNKDKNKKKQKSKQGNSNKTRKTNVSKNESSQWKKFDNVKGKDYKTSGQGAKKQYYRWDHTHNDIEVYDSNEKHIGSMDPTTGKIYKSAVKGRKL